jgi:signal peptidase I
MNRLGPSGGGIAPMKQQMQHKRRKVRMRRLWREWVRPVIPVVLVLLMVRSAVADWNDVPTGSMKPTILEGDRIFVNKLAYDVKVPFLGWNLGQIGDPQRGDIIVFFAPGDGTRMVKRIVGLPGDAIEMRRNRLYVNNEPVSYQSSDVDAVPGLREDERMHARILIEDLGEREHPIMITPALGQATRSFAALRLSADEYFVMGDNRDNSQDSRSFGVVTRRLISGRATRVVLSVDPRAWTFRWDRLLRPLQ